MKFVSQELGRGKGKKLGRKANESLSGMIPRENRGAGAGKKEALGLSGGALRKGALVSERALLFPSVISQCT